MPFTVPAWCDDWKNVPSYTEQPCHCVTVCGAVVPDCTGCRGCGKIATVATLGIVEHYSAGRRRLIGDPRFDPRVSWVQPSPAPPRSPWPDRLLWAWLLLCAAVLLAASAWSVYRMALVPVTIKPAPTAHTGAQRP